MQMCRLFLAGLIAVGILGPDVLLTGCASLHGHPTGDARGDDYLRGKTVRWTFIDPNQPSASYEHVFREDGSVVWTVLDGAQRGRGEQEKAYAAFKVAPNVYVVSYRSKTGQTLTALLDLETARVRAFISNKSQWQMLEGPFEILAAGGRPSTQEATAPSVP